jgi:hypothetical protein
MSTINILGYVLFGLILLTPGVAMIAAEVHGGRSFTDSLLTATAVYVAAGLIVGAVAIAARMITS